MNREQIEGKWEQLKGKVREQWGKLTDDDIAAIQGKTEQLEGKIRERYGYSKEQAQKDMKTFFEQCDCGSASNEKTKSGCAH